MENQETEKSSRQLGNILKCGLLLHIETSSDNVNKYNCQTTPSCFPYITYPDDFCKNETQHF